MDTDNFDDATAARLGRIVAHAARAESLLGLIAAHAVDGTSRWDAVGATGEQLLDLLRDVPDLDEPRGVIRPLIKTYGEWLPVRNQMVHGFPVVDSATGDLVVKKPTRYTKKNPHQGQLDTHDVARFDEAMLTATEEAFRLLRVQAMSAVVHFCLEVPLERFAVGWPVPSPPSNWKLP